MNQESQPGDLLPTLTPGESAVVRRFDAALRSGKPVEVDGFLRVARAEHDVGIAPLPVPLQRIARHAGAEENQIVEARHSPLGAPAADRVEPRLSRPLDLVDHVAVERSRLLHSEMARRGGRRLSSRRHERSNPALSI